VAFTRVLVSFALCEAAALAPLVAFMVTRDLRLLALVAVDVLALVLLFPTPARWERLEPGSFAQGDVRAAPSRAALPREVR